MGTQSRNLNVFLLGAGIGILGGFVVGLIATLGRADELRSSFRGLAARISRRGQSLRFDLLEQ